MKNSRVKRLTALLLALVMIMSMFPFTVFADDSDFTHDASGFTDDYYWSYNAETSTLYFNTTNDSGEIDCAEIGNGNCVLPLGYYTDEEETQIAFYGDGTIYAENIIIGNNVKALYNCDFYFCCYPELKTVTFEENSHYEYVTDYMFQCTQIKELTLPDSVKIIGESAFEDSDLEHINLGNGLVSIRYSAFRGSDIVEVDFPASLSSLNSYAFSNCKELERVSFSEDNDHYLGIPLCGFSGCSKLSQIDFPKRIVEIGESGLRGTAITSIDLSYQVTHSLNIEYSAFADCKNLTEVILPYGTDFVRGLYQFSNCTSLETFIIEDETEEGASFILPPESETVIPQCLFKDCTSLKTVKLPDSIEKIQNGAFENAFDENANVCLDLTNTVLSTLETGAFNKSNLAELKLPNTIEKLNSSFTNSKLRRFVFPESITNIVNGLFKDCQYLNYVDMSKAQLDTIPSNCFNCAVSLREVILPENLEAIGTNAFKQTNILQSVTLPETVTSIGDNAFFDSGIEEINFPSGLTSIGCSAFYNTALINVDLSGCNNGLAIEDNAFEYTYCLESVSMPQENFTIIPTSCFAESGLKSINLPCVSSISEYAFENADQLQRIVIPDGCNFIGTEAFAGCQSLTNVRIPHSVVGFGTRIFTWNSIREFICESTVWLNCQEVFGSSIINATVHGFSGTALYDYCQEKNITFISLNPDDYDYNLDPYEDVYYGGTWSRGTFVITRKTDETFKLTIFGAGPLETACYDAGHEKTSFLKIIQQFNVTSLKISDGVTSIPNSFLSLDKAGTTVTEIELPDTLTEIGEKAFYYQRGFTSISLPDSLKKIGANAFRYTNLEEIELNEGLETIGSYAFGSTKINTITFPSTLKSLGTGIFDNSYIKGVNTDKVTELKTIPSSAFANALNLVAFSIPACVTQVNSNAFNNCPKLAVVFVKNEDCVFSSSSIGYSGSVKNKAFSIVAPEGSTAQAYANSNGFGFAACATAIDYFGIINQANYYNGNAPISWFYTHSNKTLNIVGNDYFNTSEFLSPDGTPFTEDIDVKVVKFNDGILRAQASLAQFNPSLVIFPDCLKEIDERVFRGCTNLLQIYIPENVTDLHKEAFKDCKNLQYIKFGSIIPENICKGLSALKFVDFGSATQIGKHAFDGCTNLQEVVIPDTITNVGEYAFNKCTAVQSITLGSGIQSIGGYAFSRLPLCEKITINARLGSAFSSMAFFDSGTATAGVTVVYGDNVESINLSGIKSIRVSKIIIGKNVSSVDNSSEVPALKSVEVSDENPNYYSFYNCLYSSDDVLVLVPQMLNVVDIKEGTKIIDKYAFYRSMVSTIVVPDTVEKINEKAFFEAEKIKIVHFGTHITEIGKSAFEGCKLLKTADLPYGITKIGDRAFYDCPILASVIIPEGVTSIGVSAFANCPSIKGVVIPESVESIGAAAFAYCPELTDFYVWYSTLDYNMFYKSPKVNVYTMVGSPAYEYCRRLNIPYEAYTDEDCFYDECALKIDVLAGYLGFCSDGHGDIVWLDVYNADCENDGYKIGVCEYCSEILDEEHVNASGHSYIVKAEIEPTRMTRGMTIYECQNCETRYCTYTEATGDGTVVETHNVTGKVVISTNNSATDGRTPITNASIVIDGMTVATTDSTGIFSIELETGVYEAEIRYAYGFTRVVYIIVEDEDIDYEMPIPIIGCDFNKDGKIDNEDLTLFQYVVSSKSDDPSYLAFVDMNNDGYINAKDRAYINSCKGLDASTFNYENLIIRK